MLVKMMHVRDVRMRVAQTDVPVKMSVAFPRRIRSAVCMLVMLVVTMPVLVQHAQMLMLVLVVLGNMQIDTDHH